MQYQELIKQDIFNIVEELKVQPILFIGSGLSQRYFKAPNWTELMKQLTEKCPNLNREFPYYRQRYHSDYTLMAEDFIEPYQSWAWDIKTKDNIFYEALFLF